jgi:hypothetical protein
MSGEVTGSANPWLDPKNRDMLREQRLEQIEAGVYGTYPQRLNQDLVSRKILGLMAGERLDDETTVHEAVARALRYPLVPFVDRQVPEMPRLALVQVDARTGNMLPSSDAGVAMFNAAEPQPVTPFMRDQVQLLARHAVALEAADLVPLSTDLTSRQSTEQ